MGKKRRRKRKWGSVKEACVKNAWLDKLFRQLQVVHEQCDTVKYQELMSDLNSYVAGFAHDAKQPPRTSCKHSDLIRQLFAALHTSKSSGKAHKRVNTIAKMMTEIVEFRTDIKVPEARKQAA